MKKILVSIFAVAMVVALAMPVMAAVKIDLPGNGTVTVAPGITFKAENKQGTKYVYLTITNTAAAGTLSVVVWKDTVNVFDTTAAAGNYTYSSKNGAISYIWEPVPVIDPYYVELFLYKHDGADYVGGKLYLEINGNPAPVLSASANQTTRFKIVAVPDAGYKLKDDADFYTHYYHSYVKNAGNDFAFQWNIAEGVETSVLPWDATLTGVRIQVAATDWEFGPFEKIIVAPLDLAKLEKWLAKGWDLKRLIDAEDEKFSDKSPEYYNKSYLWNTNGVQTLYSYLVDSTHNVLNNPAATQAEVDLAVSNLKAAYKGAVDVLNLHLAKIKLNNWVYKASDLIEILKANGLWNEYATQNLYTWMVYGHNDVYDVEAATIVEVKEALAKLKAAYPEALALLDVLAQARLELTEWITKARELKLELDANLIDFNAPAFQEMYYWMVYGQNDVLPNPAATLGEINNVIAKLKAAYPEALALLDLPQAKAELKSAADSAWTLVLTLQAYTGADLWNTPACQTLYVLLTDETSEVRSVLKNAAATLVEVQAALANLNAAVADAEGLLP